MKTCFIQLGAHGDLVSLLPVFKAAADRGEDVHVMTRAEYADTLECVTYVKPVVVGIQVQFPFFAEAMAKRMGFERIVMTHTHFNDRTDDRMGLNFQIQQWKNGGMLEDMHDAETVFDNRDYAAEAQAIADHVPPDDGRPLLVFNMSGKSQPYMHADCQRAWLGNFIPEYRTVDLSELLFDKFHHVLGIVEKADIVVTVDTSIVHVANALNKPLIVLWPQYEMARSEPKANWVYACTHFESVTPECRAAIRLMLITKDFRRGRLVRPIPLVTRVDYAQNHWWTDEDKPAVMKAFAAFEELRQVDKCLNGHFTDTPNATLCETIDKAIAPIIIWGHRATPLLIDSTEKARDVLGAAEISDGLFAFTREWWARNRDRFEGITTEIGTEPMREIVNNERLHVRLQPCL